MIGCGKGALRTNSEESVDARIIAFDAPEKFRSQFAGGDCL